MTDYLENKVKPIIEPIIKSVILTKPEDIVKINLKIQ